MGSQQGPQDAAGDTPGEGAAFPQENPNRPREYHGARTLIVALLILLAVGLPLWLTLGGGDNPSTQGDFGIVALPPYLNPAALPAGDEIGRLAPDFELETLDGDRFRLSDWRGHPVVVNFWASWCTPCRREVPVLIRLQDQFRDDGLIIVGVNIEEARSPARSFAGEFGINFRLPMDFTGGVTRAYGISGQLGPPHTFFVDPDGVVRDIFRGQGPDDAFEQVVGSLVTTLSVPVGPRLLPGPKALPTGLDDGEAAVGPAVGDLAPDLALIDAQDPQRLWRLSDQRGAAQLLVFVRPGCANCDDELRRTVEAAARAGVRPVIIRTPSPPLPTPAPYDALVWERHSAALFGAGASVEYALIDAGGLIEALPADDADTAVLLAARPVPAPAAPADG